MAVDVLVETGPEVDVDDGRFTFQRRNTPYADVCEHRRHVEVEFHIPLDVDLDSFHLGTAMLSKTSD